jgi:protein-export chaperone SecB
MAEDEGILDIGMNGNGADQGPEVGLLNQYVKDLSFENPNAPAVYQWQSQPQIDVQFNIGSQQLNDEVFEVAVKIEISARADGQAAFQVELVYAGPVRSSQHTGRAAAALPAGRSASSAFPVRAPGRRRCGSRRRLSRR